ncbi:hypothetical protein W02_31260 [Nitrospira sp. KM1]|nr:hypothetical protein W02_31260 [Nitrospira sp. KM1]
MFKKAFRQGRSEVRDAKNNERHGCGRARVGERPVSWRRIVSFLTRPPTDCGNSHFPWPYAEPLSDARTQPEDFFNILLGGFALCAVCLLPAGCVSPQQLDDDRLAARIDEAFLRTDELNLSRLEVNVEGDVIYLSGMSDDHESKSHAETITRSLAEGKRVVNKIEVDF